MSNPPKLLDRMADVLRTRHYSDRTREAYVAWVRRFILFHNKRHPSSMGGDEVNAYLTALATRDHVSAATQNQALCAILFLYRHVLGDPLPWIDGVVRAQRPARLPVVLTHDEVDQVLTRVEGLSGLVARLLYGSGLRLLEALRLRVKDVDFARRQLLIRDPKGRRDRATMLPKALTDPIREQLTAARTLHEAICGSGSGRYGCPMHWRESCPMRRGSGRGNGSSPQRAAGVTRRPASSEDTTSTKVPCSAPFAGRRSKRA